GRGAGCGRGPGGEGEERPMADPARAPGDAPPLAAGPPAAVPALPSDAAGAAERIPRSRRPLAIVAVLAALAVAAVAAWRLFFAAPALPPGIVAASGRIEGDDSAVAAKTTGRVREITVREGDPVEAGQLIAVLDGGQVRAREQHAQAAGRQAAARRRVRQ